MSANSLQLFVEEQKEIDLNFKIEDLFSLSPIKARKLIWRVIQQIMQFDKSNRSAYQVKTFVSGLYNFVNEEKGIKITWQKNKHRVPVIKIRDDVVPTHNQIYKMVDYATHLRDKAMILLSYHSGLKGIGLINLTVGDVKSVLENYLETGELPLIIKINAGIYPKRFKNNTKMKWYPALCDKDCAEMLVKYYRKERLNAKDDEPFFVTRTKRKLRIQRVSIQIRYVIDKIHADTGELGKNTYAMLIRNAFYNRLSKGNMKNIYREFLMGHSLGIRGHYFDWDSVKDEIIEGYLASGFNRVTEVRYERRNKKA